MYSKLLALSKDGGWGGVEGTCCFHDSKQLRVSFDPSKTINHRLHLETFDMILFYASYCWWVCKQPAAFAVFWVLLSLIKDHISHQPCCLVFLHHLPCDASCILFTNGRCAVDVSSICTTQLKGTTAVKPRTSEVFTNLLLSFFIFVFITTFFEDEDFHG